MEASLPWRPLRRKAGSSQRQVSSPTSRNGPKVPDVLAGDSTVKIWCTSNLSLLYTIVPYLDSESGDIYSITYSPKLSTVYFGCQNTSIQWLDLSHIVSPSTNGVHSSIHSSPSPTPGTPKRFHKFFDSVPKAQRNAAHSAPSLSVPSASIESTCPSTGVNELYVPSTNVVLSHYGYIYSMALVPSHLYSVDDEYQGDETYLLTGSGDEEVKVCSVHLCPAPIEQSFFSSGLPPKKV